MFALHIFERLYPVRCNRKSNIRFLIDYNCENDKKDMTKLKRCGFILNAWLICTTDHKQYKKQ